MTPGLAALIHPAGVPELRDHLVRDEPFVGPGRRAAGAARTGVPVVASLESLLGAWPDVVEVHLPDVADEASAVTASPADARKLFANGMGLLFDEAQRHARELVPARCDPRGPRPLGADASAA
ncbi:MAG: hypothetical protein WKG01_35420 [Kofleriaceae bacterium]